MPRLPLASGKIHLRVFESLGWKFSKVKGSHHILTKETSDATLSIPIHGKKDLDTGLLKRLIRDAGLTNEEYIEAYKRRK